MNLKKLAAYCGTAIAGFVVGKKITDARWEYALIKFQTELEEDAKRRREENRYKHPSYMSYSRYYPKKAERKKDAWRDIVFETKDDAIKVAKDLNFIIHKYGFATIADLYDLVGVESTYQDEKLGWDDMEEVDLFKTHGGYTLVFPEPVDSVKLMASCDTEVASDQARNSIIDISQGPKGDRGGNDNASQGD